MRQAWQGRAPLDLGSVRGVPLHRKILVVGHAGSRGSAEGRPVLRGCGGDQRQQQCRKTKCHGIDDSLSPKWGRSLLQILRIRREAEHVRHFGYGHHGAQTAGPVVGVMQVLSAGGLRGRSHEFGQQKQFARLGAIGHQNPRSSSR